MHAVDLFYFLFGNLLMGKFIYGLNNHTVNQELGYSSVCMDMVCPAL